MKLSVAIKKKLGNFCLDVQFETEAGVLALLGASGCGKSMTLKCIAGIERPDEGRITLGDRVLFDSEKKIDLAPQKRRIGYMFQDYALFPNMTARQNVAVGMQAKGADKREIAAKTEEYLRRFHIEDLADHYPNQLSGGQKQRVAMARLVAQNPEAVLLDEPFSALDSHLKWQLEQEMKETLAAVDVPVIFVSHDRDEVYHLAETVCCLDQGKVDTVRPMKDFFAEPRTRQAAILSGCKNVGACEIIDARRLRVPAWGLELEMPCDIPAETKYVGIRAHALVPVEEWDDGCNGDVDFAPGCNGDVDFAHPCGVQRSTSPLQPGAKSTSPLQPHDISIREDPFEWTVFFRAAPDAPEKLQWKTAKKEGEALRVPEGFVLDPEKVMLLS